MEDGGTRKVESVLGSVGGEGHWNLQRFVGFYKSFPKFYGIWSNLPKVELDLARFDWIFYIASVRLGGLGFREENLPLDLSVLVL